MATTELKRLEDELHIDLVPGTEVMTNVGVSQHFATTGNSDIVLIPQPSSDPNDPLNWSATWSWLALSSMLLVTFSQVFGPLALSPVFPQLAKDFHTDIDGAVEFTGITVLLLGFGNFVWVPMSDTFGRRSVLLVTSLITFAGALWRALATSYSSFLGASIVLGIGAGQSVQPAVIADLVFLHKRGLHNTIFFTVFFFGVILGPILQGVMAQAVGWRSFWWLNTGLNAFSFIVVLFAFPETKWDRKAGGNGDGNGLPSTGATSTDSEAKEMDTSVTEEEGEGSNATAALGKGGPSRRQFNFFQPHPSPLKSLITGFWLPFKLVIYPIVPWAALIHGFSAVCYLVITIIQSTAFTAAPYHFSTQAVGFINFASLIGSLLGLFTAGPASDWVSMRLTKRNGGVREPEMRLLTLIPYTILMIVGMVVLGVGLDRKWRWEVIVVIGYGLVGVQAPAVSSIATTYAVDSYKPAAGAIFVQVTLARALWGYGASKIAEPMARKDGYYAPFILNMALLAFLLVLAAPLWFFGKKLRRITARSSVHTL